MKSYLLSLGLLCSVALTAQHANFQQIFYQLEELPGFYNSFIEEYTYDVNQNLNQSFFYNLQSTAEVMDTGEFSVGLLAGFSTVWPTHKVNDPSHPLYNNDNLSFQGAEIPTFFNGGDATIRFVFLDPNTGQEVVNPEDGSTVDFILETPAGLNQYAGSVPSAAVSLGYGVGYGTEVRGYIMPRFGLVASAVTDEVTISNDYAFGVSLKHEITTWIPYLHSRGWHISVDGAYSQLTASVRGAFVGDLESEITTDFSDDYEVIANANLEGLDYALSTYGSRLFVSKTFSWIEITAFGGYLSNTYSMNSVGSIEATLRDKSGSNPDTDLTLEDFADFKRTNTEMFWGASTTIGKGWFRFNFSYANTGNEFITTGFNFYF